MKDSQLFYVQVCRGLTGRPYIKSLSDFEQRILFYILLSENNNYTGIYSVPLSHIAGDCNSSPDKIIKAIARLSELNLLKYDNDIVLINPGVLKIDIDAVRHNNQKLTGIKRHLQTLYINTHSILIKEFIINNKLDEVIDEVIDDTTYTYTNTLTLNKDQIIQKDQINRGIVKGGNPFLKVRYNKSTQKWEGIDDAVLSVLKKLYPNVEIEKQIEAAGRWIYGHDKQYKDMKRFLCNWMDNVVNERFQKSNNKSFKDSDIKIKEI